MAAPNSRNVKMDEQHVDGIGIVEYFKGKELLITGATGFLVKVLIEKILREIPEVGKIYLLIRATNAEVALHRLKTEIIRAELFKLLQQRYEDSYEAFMLSKLVPVVGNMCDSDLGLQQHLASHISNRVHVIISSAANTKFDERYEVATQTNVNGPCNLIAFGKKCSQLKLFLHVSTVFVNGEREGTIMEKPLRIGDSIAREKYFQGQQAPNLSPPPILDVGHELQLAQYSKQAFSHHSSHTMKELGLTRAKMFGWVNTYQFTKAMGEMMIDNMREDVPVIIIRPSLIESTLNEPFPGWIQGNRGLDPLIINYGNGKIPGFVADPTNVADIIPADMVANAILAAIAMHGSTRQELGQDMKVYNVGSSTVNPIMFQDIFKMFYQHFNSCPEIDPVNGIAIRVSPFQIFNSLEGFSDAIGRHVFQQQPNENVSNKLKISLDMSIKRLEHMAKLYNPYMFYRGRFDTSNMEKLIERMSAEEKKKFHMDVRSINWENYIRNIHISGVKKHVMIKEVKIESTL